MKKGAGHSKGSAFEREICTLLSEWWTAEDDEPRDDVFWRSTISGGRATQRSKKGKKTQGQYGDIQAVDPCGKPLTDFVTIELKRGYANAPLSDLLETDKNKRSTGRRVWLSWIRQVEAAQDAAGTLHWMLIVRRDRKCPLVITTQRLRDTMKRADLDVGSCVPQVSLIVDVGPEGIPDVRYLFVTGLFDFLRVLGRDNVLRWRGVKL